MKRMIALPAALLLLLSAPLTAAAAPYQNYTYDTEGAAQAEPQAYIPSRVISGEDVGAGGFSGPKDVFVSGQGRIYIADTGNDRIVVLDDRYRLVRVIGGFANNGAGDRFDRPCGVFVDQKNILYVADTENRRIVALREDGTLYRVIGTPESELLGDGFDYSPMKVAVDSAERLYIVSKNVNQGMLEINRKGEFWGFFGAVKTVPDLALIMKKAIATKEQKEQMLLTVPTEYSSCDLDEKDFVYGTVSAVGSEKIDTAMFVHRLNPMGNDVLRRSGFFDPMGDVRYKIDVQKGELKPSQLCDVAVRDHGIYSVLDSRRGRIFTYTANGDLMYLFGAMGESLGQFGAPEALDTLGDAYLVADSKFNWLAVFEPTKYGEMVTQAVRSYAKRDYAAADRLWEEILGFTSKSDLAFKGMGQSLIKKGKYREALTYLKLASDKKNYSVAFRHYREELADRYFTLIVLCLALAPPLLFFSGRLVKRRNKSRKEPHG